MRAFSSPMRVTQEGPVGLSLYCPVQVIVRRNDEQFLEQDLALAEIKTVCPSFVVGGVDTHKALHVTAVVDEKTTFQAVNFATSRLGYRQMLAWMASFGMVARIGVECTGSYSAGLLRYLQNAGSNYSG